MRRGGAKRDAAVAALAEVFRERGYEGASLAALSKASGLGKASLYHFFPEGKEEMLVAVLANIDAWFEAAIFRSLDGSADPATAIAAMFDAVDAYFASGRRVCVVGALALDASRDRFAEPVQHYFSRWVAALAGALVRRGQVVHEAQALAEEVVAGIQGAIVLSRALNDAELFGRVLARLRAKTGDRAGATMAGAHSP